MSDHVCGNCDWSGPLEDLKTIQDLAERIDGESIMPSGECPECRCLAYDWEELKVYDERQQQLMPVTDIVICKLSYHRHPFVHGVRNGKDVWLLTNGFWTEVDGHANASIHLHEDITIIQKETNDARNTQ